MKKDAQGRGEIVASADAESADVEEITAEFPNSERKQHNVILAARRFEFHGPIPPPDTLAKYQNIDPEIPRQIMAMARDRQHYVQNANTRDQETRNTLRQRGQWLSFIVAIVSLLGGIGLGAWFVAIGHIWPGMVLSVVSLINTALIFVKGEILFRFFDGKNRKK